MADIKAVSKKYNDEDVYEVDDADIKREVEKYIPEEKSPSFELVHTQEFEDLDDDSDFILTYKLKLNTLYQLIIEVNEDVYWNGIGTKDFVFPIIEDNNYQVYGCYMYDQPQSETTTHIELLGQTLFGNATIYLYELK